MVLPPIIEEEIQRTRLSRKKLRKAISLALMERSYWLGTGESPLSIGVSSSSRLQAGARAEVNAMTERVKTLEEIYALRQHVDELQESVKRLEEHKIEHGTGTATTTSTNTTTTPRSGAIARLPTNTESVLQDLENQREIDDTMKYWLMRATAWDEHDLGWQVQRLVSRLRASMGPTNQTITLNDAWIPKEDCRALACLLHSYGIRYSKAYAGTEPWDMDMDWL